MVSWKGKLPAGKVYDHPVIQLEFLPTGLAAAGVEVKAESKLDGVDLLPYLRGRWPPPPNSAFLAIGQQMAIAKAILSWSSIPMSSRGRVERVVTASALQSEARHRRDQRPGQRRTAKAQGARIVGSMESNPGPSLFGHNSIALRLATPSSNECGASSRSYGKTHSETSPRIRLLPGPHCSVRVSLDCESEMEPEGHTLPLSCWRA